MTEASHLSWYDPRRLLSLPGVYSLHSRIFGPADKKRFFVETVLEIKAGDRVLDIGCGPADLLEFFPSCDYHGFDADADYISRAKDRFGAIAKFETAFVSQSVVDGLAPFDIAIANGVLHHLDDETAVELFKTAKAALKPGGRLITSDGTFEPGQNILGKALIKMDRGQFIRTSAAYETLAKSVFGTVEVTVYHDLSALPYAHCVLRCYIE